MPTPERAEAAPARAKTQAAFFAEQAGDSCRRGQDLLAAGDAAGALRWIERARRFAPEDDTLRFLLGLALLRLGEPARAACVLDDVARRCDLREVWGALASALAALGRSEAAAAALLGLLARHVLPDDPGFAPLADGIARAAGWPGWCGRSGDGSIAAVAEARVRAALDGAPFTRLARPPAQGRLALAAGGRALLGSPLDLAVFARVEGFVAVRDGGLQGWAWHPGDPDAAPRLTLRDSAGRTVLTLTADDTDIPAPRPLARPRGFVIPAARLGRAAGPLHVTGADGRDLTGSPLDPSLEWRSAVAVARSVAAALPVRPGRRAAVPVPALAAVPADAWAPPAAARPDPARPVAVVVPVYAGARQTLACLAAVLASVPPGTALLVVDDATPEPGLARALDALAAARRIVLLRQPRNRGFPASANAGLRAARALPGGPDVVLLNSDTLVPPGWLTGLRAAVHAAPDIGTATPLSNDATILSYPEPDRANPAPDAAALRRLAARAARVNAGTAIDIPTAVGFCMYIRRECLDATGLFRAELFAQGYGEENDFCLRARHLGWRHVAVPAVFVAHLGGVSFGATRPLLLARNLALLERLHPGWHAVVAAFARADPLAEARRRLDAAALREAAPRAMPAVLLVTHDSGGGVERVVRDRCAALLAAGRRPIVLRPVRATAGERSYRPGLCLVCDGAARTTPNLRFALPAELPALERLLRATRPEAMEVHHLLGHHRAVLDLPARLGIPYDVHVHDYAAFCPRITLLGPQRRYCGEPEAVAACEACVAQAGRALEEDIGIAALRARSAAELAGARRVTAPSADAAARLRRRFPGIEPVLRPPADDAALPPRLPAPTWAVRRICVVGGIGPEKGYDVLLGCGRDAAARGLPLEFVLVGHTPDDAALLATGRVFVTGPYVEAEAVAEIAAQRAQSRLPALAVAGDLVLHPRRSLGGRPRRGGVRHRRPGRAGAAHRARLDIAARSADTGCQ